MVSTQAYRGLLEYCSIRVLKDLRESALDWLGRYIEYLEHAEAENSRIEAVKSVRDKVDDLSVVKKDLKVLKKGAFIL
jgi:hypothetical protein